MKHYSIISDFYHKTSASQIKNAPISSLIDLIYSNDEQKFIFYDDTLYGDIVDNVSLDWDLDQVIIVAPENHARDYSPEGFNKYNQQSLKHFAKIYSAFSNDIRAVLCAKSHKKSNIIKDNYTSFIINHTSSYDACLSFCKQHYQKREIVLDIGEYARRGGIIDIYPEMSSTPKRIVFLDDCTKICEFNPDTQISSSKIKELKIPIKTQSKDLIDSIALDHIDWNTFEINESGLLINKNTNNKIDNFPFAELYYSDYKRNHKLSNISYQKVNRMTGFVVDVEKIIVPDWFKNKSDDFNPPLIDMTTISPGDYVVHRDYGIGQFIGLKEISLNNKNKQELLIIKYADGSNLSVDINHIENITFYAGREHDVSLNSLTKSYQWKKRTQSTIKNVQKIVNKLVNTYINRESAYRGEIIKSNEEDAFINEFEYIDTIDQARAWSDIKADLRSNAPMDRLICGDVGFGKTEIAIRTAYRYASNSKKTIVLAPTTILTQQLYSGFYERLKNHAININSISRLKNTNNIQTIKNQWVNNKLDILIGTHALLYNDLYLNGCDLLIIDEEHRFGVKQKEKIKELNSGIDILTMSATPIPRTLNMALSGMKKISTLSSAPKYRKPINTIISYYNEEIIVSAINNEIFRKGQVYFVHNNVDTINVVVDFINKKLPYVKVESIHGKMDAKIVESRMEKFTNKEINVLVCTSIIENGIDISNVNTIIINNAHKFGLSQLYQIRGRVGRSTQQAYALLMIPKNIQLNQDAYKRLKAIEKYTQLGAGYKIANMDLTIRGSGSVFGYDQSGNIENIGYELVAKLINENMPNQKNINSKISFLNKGMIPIDYIDSETLRLLMYRKIKNVNSFEDLAVLLYEFNNRFGALPTALIRIIDMQKIYILSKAIGISLIEEKKDLIIIQFQASLWSKKISALLNKINEFINKQEINYKIEEFQESLILKININQEIDSIKFVGDFMHILKDEE